jgi:hypothetical protein
VALGPSDDGGYYLLAARAAHPRLFDAMPWSTDRVTAETLRRCQHLGLRPHVLPAWFDVDDAVGLAQLRTQLAALPVDCAQRTRAVLDGLTLKLSHAA